MLTFPPQSGYSAPAARKQRVVGFDSLLRLAAMSRYVSRKAAFLLSGATFNGRAGWGAARLTGLLVTGLSTRSALPTCLTAGGRFNQLNFGG